ncbi:MAG: hypothetical protein HYU57_01090 [Micavibrio aeruginosavorus]|nr:hypothetical protein [Micavibrio aeruginosavorus]
MTMSILKDFKRTAGAITLALATAVTAGCGTLPRGAMTGIGAIGGGVVGGMLEPDCTTKISGTQTRSVNGNNTGAWRGSERMNTECAYSGKNAPGNFNAPQHYQHMQGGQGGGSNYRPR